MELLAVLFALAIVVGTAAFFWREWKNIWSGK